MDLLGWLIGGFIPGSISAMFTGARNAQVCLPTTVVGEAVGHAP